MSVKVAERSFEEAIECALLENGPDACAGDPTTVREALAPYGDGAAPGGYRKRRRQDYDRGLCLLPRDVVEGAVPREALARDRPPRSPCDFLLATQPKEWEKLRQHCGADV